MNDANPINPQRVFWELSPRLPDGAILAGDSGSSANWFARDLKIRKGMMASLSGNLATMGCGRAVRHRRQVRVPGPAGDRLVGDGAMQMNGNAGAHHRRQVLEGVEGPALHRAGAQQPRPEPGDVGAAGDGGRPEVRGLAGPARTSPTPRYAESIGLQGHPRGPAGPVGPRVGRGARCGPARGARGATPTRTCRRCRRTSPSSRRRTSPQSLIKGDPNAGRHPPAVPQGHGGAAQAPREGLAGPPWRCLREVGISPRSCSAAARGRALAALRQAAAPIPAGGGHVPLSLRGLGHLARRPR